jgi:hypothetical protein
MITSACRGPSPNTVCVAFLYSSHPSQDAAASRNDFKLNRDGKNSAADVCSFAGMVPRRCNKHAAFPPSARNMRDPAAIA